MAHDPPAALLTAPLRPARQAALLGASLVAFVGLHAALWRWSAGEPWRAVLPNLLLAGAAVPWLRRRSRVVGLGAGRRPRWAAAALGLMLALIAAFALTWPGGSQTTPHWSSLAAVALAGPLAEELYFRGAWLDFLARALSPAAAMLLSSALFALVHLPLGRHWHAAGLALLLGLVALATRSVLWPVGLHSLWNALAVLRETQPGPDRWPVLTLAAAAAAGCLAFALLAAKRTPHA
ncbi:MAG: CPBP family intramembrane metalloprotease [Deltaproteobacteria bacterium]|nr:CPBP family intramembrane metalloprotease [Deltaproteobacteria bacterium]